MKKPILTPILAVADIVLLVVIVVSAISAGKDKTDISVTSANESIAEETSEVHTRGSTEAFESSAMPTVEESFENILETTAVTETSETENDMEETLGVTESVITESTGENWLTPGAETKDYVQMENIRDVSQYDTKDLPHIKDFKWITPEIKAGECPKEAEEIFLEESLGGWKCYIIDNETKMERLANIWIYGREEDIDLTIDWYYIRSGGKGGDAYEDNAPDSVFTGYVNEAGELEAQGPGSIRVTDIYAIGDHMYAFGTIGWPDGIKGSLFMVRP